jgi:hypothetical protein
MGAMYGFCGSGPMKLMNLFEHHFAKNKRKVVISDSTKGAYVHHCNADENESVAEATKKEKERIGYY